MTIKRLALTGIASLAFAVGACGQSLIALDNTANYNGVFEQFNNSGYSSPHYYAGTFGMEVWELNAAAPPNLNSNGGYPYSTYWTMEHDGFNHEATFANQQMTVPGTFTLGEVLLPDVAPKGSSVVLALAVWTGSWPNWLAADTSLSPTTQDGVLAFENPTTAPATSGPPPVPAALTGWTDRVGDLVLVPIITPEPGALPLAGLGAATLLLFLRAFRRGRR
ncbi:MAG TPA: hypothetical protein VN829_10395 [Dongiaceae bacterium]|nr:hypothetical protein [Dongiaceae bacterium]